MHLLSLSGLFWFVVLAAGLGCSSAHRAGSAGDARLTLDGAPDILATPDLAADAGLASDGHRSTEALDPGLALDAPTAETQPPQLDAPFDPGTGDAGEAGVACSGVRLTVAEATVLYTRAAYTQSLGAARPVYDPSRKFALEELSVDGLWEVLHAQLFAATEEGSAFPYCPVVFQACQGAWPIDDCDLARVSMTAVLRSGLVANGAFYYSWSWGSGIFQSRFGRLAPDGNGLARIVSNGSYTNPDGNPPPLVLQVAGADILVRRPDMTAVTVSPAFNGWPTGELIGKVKEYDDHLALVDTNGVEIVRDLPPAGGRPDGSATH
jgi:hypothetical protein